jgi:hypothetical protein
MRRRRGRQRLRDVLLRSYELRRDLRQRNLVQGFTTTDTSTATEFLPQRHPPSLKLPCVPLGRRGIFDKEHKYDRVKNCKLCLRFYKHQCHSFTLLHLGQIATIRPILRSNELRRAGEIQNNNSTKSTDNESVSLIIQMWGGESRISWEEDSIRF